MKYSLHPLFLLLLTGLVLACSPTKPSARNAPEPVTEEEPSGEVSDAAAPEEDQSTVEEPKSEPSGDDDPNRVRYSQYVDDCGCGCCGGKPTRVVCLKPDRFEAKRAALEKPWTEEKMKRCANVGCTITGTRYAICD